jgi:hypothetical protein
MAINAQFIKGPRIGWAALSTAQTSRLNGTTANILTVCTGQDGTPSGTRIVQIDFVATGQANAAMVTLWLNDGTTNVFTEQVLIEAFTPSNTQPTFFRSIFKQNLVLPSSTWSLRAGLTVAPVSGTINVIAYGGDQKE